MLEAQEIQLLLLKRLVTIRRESDRLGIWAVQQKDILTTGAKLSAIEAGCPLGEGQKPLHAPALVIELLVVAQIESIEVLEKLEDHLTSKVGISHRNLELLPRAF